MSIEEPDDSLIAGAGRLIQGLMLDKLIEGMVLISLILVAYAASEGTGVARVMAVLVGVLGVALPLASWRQHWSDAVTWLVLLPLTVGILASFAWVNGG